MLKKLRIVLATLFFLGITLLFLNLGDVLQPYLGWMAKLQFLPAVLALNVLVIVGLVLLTLVFGRVYCSVICPMGVFQDLVSWISSKRKGKGLRFKFSPEKKWLRYTVLALFVIALIAGVQMIVVLIAPYSAYGRMVQNLFAPAHLWGKDIASLVVAIVTFVLIAVLAWLSGRAWCNTICPVGTTLGLLSRFSLFRMVIDTEKCKGCHLCEKKCKASCIDSDNRKIDYSRCVACFNCVDNCNSGAIKYKLAICSCKKSEKPATDQGRRAFLASSVVATGAIASKKLIATTAAITAGGSLAKAQKKVDGGLAEILPKQKPQRAEVLTPFGSKSVRDFYKHCTACQLCVSACPNNVLRPSTSLEHFMQPEMSFENGYCRPECTVCSQVCPAGAILPLTPEEKTAVHIGVARVNPELCVVNRDGVSCGNCARHCPAGAIMMVRKDPNNPNSPRIPAVNEERCIGCGACENLCPSRPISAIHVDGRSVHIND